MLNKILSKIDSEFSENDHLKNPNYSGKIFLSDYEL